MGVLEARNATTQIYRLAENVGARVRAAQTFHDPDLSPDGLSRRRAEMLQKTQQSARTKAQRILQTAQDGAAFAQSKVDCRRPKLDPESVAHS